MKAQKFPPTKVVFAIFAIYDRPTNPRTYEFKEKTVSSVQRNSFGLVPDNSDTSNPVNISKPVINFRKRKNTSVRERQSDD